MKTPTKTSWLQIRVDAARHALYMRAAGAPGLSAWARAVLDREAQRALREKRKDAAKRG